jgi:hypothetical protein
MYIFNHTLQSKRIFFERERLAESWSFNRDECHEESCIFSPPFSCRRKKDFQQKKKGQLKVDLSTVLSPKLRDESSNVEKGVLKEHLSAFLSSQWKENLPGKCKGPINIQLSTLLSDGLKEILSQFLKVAWKDQFSVTPWGAPPQALREGREAQS